jgi:hypothetical protein
VTAPFSGRDGEIEAFIVDRYLESLLARRPLDDEAVPDELRATARRLSAELPRHHPSFRFEERLALRLAEAAAAMRWPTAAGAEGLVIPLPSRARRSPAPSAPNPATGQGATDPFDRLPVSHPVVIGGVITSAAISLAGAAFVAWRRSRPAGSPMARAARAVGRTRTA